LDFQLQLDAWFDSRANVRHHRTLRCRPIDRLIEERAVMAPLAMTPDTDRRWVLRVPPDPYLRFDTCDYALGAARRDAAILRFGLLERRGRRWRHLPARSRAGSPTGRPRRNVGSAPAVREGRSEPEAGGGGHHRRADHRRPACRRVDVADGLDDLEASSPCCSRRTGARWSCLSR
jgi:hypothetical protein